MCFYYKLLIDEFIAQISNLVNIMIVSSFIDLSFIVSFLLKIIYVVYNNNNDRNNRCSDSVFYVECPVL